MGQRLDIARYLSSVEARSGRMLRIDPRQLPPGWVVADGTLGRARARRGPAPAEHPGDRAAAVEEGGKRAIDRAGLERVYRPDAGRIRGGRWVQEILTSQRDVLAGGPTRAIAEHGAEAGRTEPSHPIHEGLGPPPNPVK